MILLLCIAGLLSLVIAFLANGDAFAQIAHRNVLGGLLMGGIVTVAAPLGVGCFVVAFAMATHP